MKKDKVARHEPEMRAEYDFTGAERGKLARRFGGRVGVLLDPDVAEVFDDPVLLNNLLRAIAGIVQRDGRPRGRKAPSRRAR